VMKKSFNYQKISSSVQWGGYLFFFVFEHKYYAIRTLLNRAWSFDKKVRYS